MIVFVRNHFRPEVASDVVSGVAVETVDLNVLVKSSGSKSNRSSAVQLAHFCDER